MICFDGPLWVVQLISHIEQRVLIIGIQKCLEYLSHWEIKTFVVPVIKLITTCIDNKSYRYVVHQATDTELNRLLDRLFIGRRYQIGAARRYGGVL